MQRLALYWKLTRFDKPIGIQLLLWPTLTALWLASHGKPGWQMVLIFILGTALMRAAGCAINDYADRDFDKYVKRTAQRPLTSGKIAGWEALMVAAVLAIASFALILPLNQLTKLLSLAAVLIAASYPYFKRFFGIPMAYAAIQNQVPAIAWLLLLANIFWALAYDTEYAMVDRDDDIKIGIRTSALAFGRFDVIAVMCCYAIYFAILAGVGWSIGLGYWFAVGLLAAVACSVYHYFLIRHRDRDACFKAFRHNNWLGCFVFIGLVLDFTFSH